MILHHNLYIFQAIRPAWSRYSTASHVTCYQFGLLWFACHLFVCCVRTCPAWVRWHGKKVKCVCINLWCYHRALSTAPHAPLVHDVVSCARYVCACSVATLKLLSIVRMLSSVIIITELSITSLCFMFQGHQGCVCLTPHSVLRQDNKSKHIKS